MKYKPLNVTDVNKEHDMKYTHVYVVPVNRLSPESEDKLESFLRRNGFCFCLPVQLNTEEVLKQMNEGKGVGVILRKMYPNMKEK